jgi:FtsP/CotA-like multicopper oxidase with cupredoxin domain
VTTPRRSFAPRTFSRRDLLRAGIYGAAAASTLPIIGCGSSASTFVQDNPGQTPIEVVRATLECVMATFSIGGMTYKLPSYNSVFPGPVIRCRPGQRLEVEVINNLPPNLDPTPPDINIPHHFYTTNLHFHGSHVSPFQDDIFTEIPPGESKLYTYDLPLDQAPGTHHYHPHKHSAVTWQMFGGMGSILIVDGPLDDVPEIAAATEVPIVINELMLNPALPVDGVSGSVPLFTKLGGVFSPNFRTWTMNGQVNPVFSIRPGEVQYWRVLQQAVSQAVPFCIVNTATNERVPLHTVAYDGIAYDQVQTVEDVLMAPANRVDFLIKGPTTPGMYEIRKLAFEQFAGAPTPEVTLGTLMVTNDTPDNMGIPTGALPSPSFLPPVTTTELNRTDRTIVYDVAGSGGPNADFPNNFTVDGVRFDPNNVGNTFDLGAAEEITLLNPSNRQHPFHIHINPFQVVGITGTPADNFAIGRWQDTILIPQFGSVTIRTRFQNYTGPFVNHCHFLAHEDQGMMQVVEVV